MRDQLQAFVAPASQIGGLDIAAETPHSFLPSWRSNRRILARVVRNMQYETNGALTAHLSHERSNMHDPKIRSDVEKGLEEPRPSRVFFDADGARWHAYERQFDSF